MLEPIIEAWFRSLGSREEVLKFLLDRHYLAAPVLDLRQTVELIKREGRGALQNLNVPGYGEIPVPKVPYLFSETTVEFQPILSMVGEDNRDIACRPLRCQRSGGAAGHDDVRLVSDQLLGEQR